MANPTEKKEVKKVLDKAIRATRKRLSFRPKRELAKNLEFAVGDITEAYELGVQEAQNVLVGRLLALRDAEDKT